jgi:AraC-like DNA-binding protein
LLSVPPAFRLPEGLSIRYDAPDASLAEAITGYHVYRARAAEERIDWFLPGTADIVVALDAPPIALSIRRRIYDPLPQMALIGPTSQAMRATTRGGTLIGIGLTALGWSRFFPRSASEYRDRVVPLAEAATPGFAALLLDALDATDRDGEVKPAIDRLLARHLAPPHADAPQIRRLMDLIVDDAVDGLPALAQALGLPPHALRRLSARHFGFPPKLLLLRARFLRSFVRMVLAGDVLDYALIEATYYDVSHFLRDARTFLGTTPKRFMAQPTTFLEGSLHARAATLGAAAQVLHTIPQQPLGTQLDALAEAP